jgi:hypothetical protein
MRGADSNINSLANSGFDTSLILHQYCIWNIIWSICSAKYLMHFTKYWAIRSTKEQSSKKSESWYLGSQTLFSKNPDIFARDQKSEPFIDVWLKLDIIQWQLTIFQWKRSLKLEAQLYSWVIYWNMEVRHFYT